MEPHQWPHIYDHADAALMEINATQLPQDLNRESVADRFKELLLEAEIDTAFFPIAFLDDEKSVGLNLTIAFEKETPAKTIRILEAAINAEMRTHDLMGDYRLTPTVINVYKQICELNKQPPPKDPAPPGLG